MKVAGEAQTEMRWAKTNFERKLAKCIDTDCISFYAYVNNRSRAKPSVGPLINGNNSQMPQNEMANEFNSYFSSVFTVEDTVGKYPCDQTYVSGPREGPAT